MSALSLVPSAFWLFAAGCFGAIFGSFVNMAAYRLPRNISTVKRTRSFCPSCQAQLAWHENIPILSFLALRGRCGHCKTAIPIRYLLVELTVTALFVLCAFQFFVLNQGIEYTGGARWWRTCAVFAVQLFFCVDLVLLSVIDLETWLIPEATTQPWMYLGVVSAPFVPELHASATEWLANAPHANALIDSLMGLVLGAGALWAVGYLTTLFTFFYYRISKRADRPKEGMGLGDVHLMAMVGALLGWKAAMMTIFLGVFIGSFSGAGKILWDKFQRWRLGSRYKPWQPVYDLPEGEEALQAPRIWPFLAMGVLVLTGAVWLHEQAQTTFSGTIAPTLEERQTLVADIVAARYFFDLRMIPLVLMFGIGLLLISAAGFFSYLIRSDMLPQGSIVEKESGQKEEVLDGNYIPFGPSLALAALLVAFYDPLMRNVAYWFAHGATGSPMPLPYRVIGEETVRGALVGAAQMFNAAVQSLIGG